MEMENVEEAELERREVKDPEKNGNKWINTKCRGKTRSGEKQEKNLLDNQIGHVEEEEENEN